MNYRPHHVAISTADLQRAIEFYSYFGFAEAVRWLAKDGTLVIVHMMHPSALVLEIFAYSENSSETRRDPAVGNDLEDVGVKHLALNVDDLEAARNAIEAAGFERLTEIQHGRTRVDYFFVQDPDGNWLEIVSDKRSLPDGDVLVIRQE